MRERIVTAIATASVGTLCFATLGALLLGLVGSLFETIGCFTGAFVATFVVVRSAAGSIRANLLPAIVIVAFTFLTIAAAHAVEQPLVRGVAIDGEWRGLLFWASVTTSWWLVPGCAWFLTLCHRWLPSRAGVRGPAA